MAKNLQNTSNLFKKKIKKIGSTTCTISVYSKADRTIDFFPNDPSISVTLHCRPSCHSVCEQYSLFRSCFCHLCLLQFSEIIKKKKKLFMKDRYFFLYRNSFFGQNRKDNIFWWAGRQSHNFAISFWRKNTLPLLVTFISTHYTLEKNLVTFRKNVIPNLSAGLGKSKDNFWVGRNDARRPQTPVRNINSNWMEHTKDNLKASSIQ